MAHSSNPSNPSNFNHSTNHSARRGFSFKLPIARSLMSAPAVWGKMPTHADFITHAMKSGHTQAWTQWLSFNAAQTKIVKPTENQTSMHYVKSPKQAWLSTQDPNTQNKAQNALSNHQATSFMLQAEELAFSKNDFVVGVIFNSMDKVGRKHPFIVYTTAKKRWLKQYWERPQHIAQDWQFWLGQLIKTTFEQSLVIAHAELSAEALNKLNNTLQTQLLLAIQQMWQLHAPRWTQFLLLPPKHPSAQQCQEIINKLLSVSALQTHPLADDSDSHHSRSDPIQPEALKGVQHMPWADWPYRMWRASSKNAFWQQDSQGRYIGAAEKLSQLKVPSFY
jgi:type VI secretion system protein ImpM